MPDTIGMQEQNYSILHHCALLSTAVQRSMATGDCTPKRRRTRSNWTTGTGVRSIPTHTWTRLICASDGGDNGELSIPGRTSYDRKYTRNLAVEFSESQLSSFYRLSTLRLVMHRYCCKKATFQSSATQCSTVDSYDRIHTLQRRKKKIDAESGAVINDSF